MAACTNTEKVGSVSVSSVEGAVQRLQHASSETQMRFLVEILDSDHTGRIDQLKLFEILKARFIHMLEEICC